MNTVVNGNNNKNLKTRLKYLLEDFWDICLGIVSVLISLYFHKNGQGELATLFAAIGIGALSLTVAEVAEILSSRLDEPYGSFVLTFSAVIVEIILLYIILLQALSNPEVVDTVKGGIISAVIVDMNVLLGLAVFLGGLKFSEQQHNKETSSAYTTILLVTGVALLVPSLLNEVKHSKEVVENASMLIAGTLFIFYIVIVIFQTKTHQHFFQHTVGNRVFRIKRKLDENTEEIHSNNGNNSDDYLFENFNNYGLIFSIFIFIAIIAVGAEVFATDGLKLAKEYGVSAGISGLIIAIVAVSPEIITAIKAAKNDEIQRVVNIAMGASTVSILITVPVLMILAYLSGIRFVLDFNPMEIGALLLTIILAWKTTEAGNTNYFEGIAHLMFFVAFAIIAAYY